MELHNDGSITGMEYIKHPSMPANQKQGDSLLNAKKMTNQERELLVQILDHYIDEDIVN